MGLTMMVSVGSIKKFISWPNNLALLFYILIIIPLT
jgi:hypothetical protein